MCRCLFQWTLEILPADSQALVRAGPGGSALATADDDDDDADSIDEEMGMTDARLLRDVRCCRLVCTFGVSRAS